jgi:putative NADH-flavin reductase
MKLLVFGATGGIGKHVVEQALAMDHEVTALARRPAAITIQHRNLKVIKGDVLDPATLNQPMIGNQAVLSCLGVANTAPTTLYSAGVSNIMRAMQDNGVRRIFCVSANGLEPGPLWQRIVAKLILWRMFKESFTDLVRMEAVVKASSLDWTIMRPPRLTDGATLGTYQIAINQHLTHGWKISRADLAHCMLNHLKDQAFECATVEVAY